MSLVTIKLTEEEASFLSRIQEKISRQLTRLQRPDIINAFLIEKKHMVPEWEDLAILAKERGLFAESTSTADAARSLQKTHATANVSAAPSNP